MSTHLEILRKARLEGDLFAEAGAARMVVEVRGPARRPSARDQWQQLVHELFLRREEAGSAVIGLVSSTAGEGTSYVAGQLAAELARTSEWNILLLEANLYRPAQAVRHGVEPDPGLRRILGDRQYSVESCLRETGVEHLWVLPAGSPAGSAAPDWTLLPRLLQWLRARFRGIVVDLPPVNLSTDTTIIGGWLDGLALVAQADLCSREVIQNAVARLRRATPHLLGAVLNKRKFVIPEPVYRRL